MLGDDDFEKRCPVLFGLLATEKKCHKRKTDATVANNTGKTTDIARIEALADARIAHDTGQATWECVKY